MALNGREIKPFPIAVSAVADQARAFDGDTRHVGRPILNQLVGESRRFVVRAQWKFDDFLAAGIRLHSGFGKLVRHVGDFKSDLRERLPDSSRSGGAVGFRRSGRQNVKPRDDKHLAGVVEEELSRLGCKIGR